MMCFFFCQSLTEVIVNATALQSTNKYTIEVLVTSEQQRYASKQVIVQKYDYVETIVTGNDVKAVEHTASTVFRTTADVNVNVNEGQSIVYD